MSSHIRKTVHHTRKYLQRMMRDRRAGRPVVCLDETCATARDSVEKMWVGDDPVVSGATI